MPFPHITEFFMSTILTGLIRVNHTLQKHSLPTLSAKVSLDFCIILDMLESASGCLGIYCFISIIPCVMRILPFQTILLPFRYCSPALTHTHTNAHTYAQIICHSIKLLRTTGAQISRISKGRNFRI